MAQSTKKTLLALSISMALTGALLTGCGSDNDNPPVVTNPDQPETPTFSVKAYADDVVFTPAVAATWTPSPLLPSRPDKSDEKVINMTMQNGRVVAINRWHNSIVNIDKSATNSAGNPQYFATLLTAEHGVDSSADDIVSGASEHLLTDVAYSDDDKILYALVRTPRGTPVQGDDTFGLFKVGLNDDGSIPSTQISNMPVSHRGDNVQRIADANFTAMLPLDNGSLLVLDDTNHAIRFYDDSFMLQTSSSFSLADNEDLQGWSADDTAIYLAIETENNVDTITQRIEKRLIATPTTVEKTLVIADEVEDLVSHGNHLLVVTDSGIHLLDNDLTADALSTFSAGIDDFSVAPDFSRIAVIDGNDKLSLIDIVDDSLGIPIPVAFDKADDFDAFTLADTNSLFFSSTRGEINKIDLDKSMVTLSDEQVVARSLKDIDPVNLNHGYPTSAVRYDLDLPTKDGNLDIAYNWSSSNPSLITSSGDVTLPTGGPSEVVLTLTGTANDGKITGTQDFTFKVLPDTQIVIDATVTDLSDAIKLPRRTYFNRIHRDFNSQTANTDGSLYALTTQIGIALLQKQSNNSVDVIVNDDKSPIMPTSSSLTFTKPTVEMTMWQGTDTLWVLIGDDSETASAGGALFKKTFTNIDDIDALDTQMKSDWTLVESFTDPVVSGLVNTNKTHLSIVTDKGNTDTVSNGYRVTNVDVTNLESDGTPTQISSYDIDVDLGNTRPSIDDSGKYIVATVWDYDEETYKLARYVNGQRDSYISLDSSFYSNTITDNGDFVAGGRSGNLLFVDDATGNDALTKDDLRKVSFARENYDGSEYLREQDHHVGRVYGPASAGNKLFVGYRMLGTSVVDISDFSNPVETKFIPFDGMKYTILPSTDGSTVLQVSGDNEFSVANVQ